MRVPASVAPPKPRREVLPEEGLKVIWGYIAALLLVLVRRCRLARLSTGFLKF
jgi:hypothetical protein